MACLARLEAKGNASGEEEKAWPTVRFAIEDMPDPGTLVGLKHQIADSDMCTGNVVDSVCNRCHSHVPGVPAYSFKLLAKDTAEPSVQLGIHVSHKGACELFKMGASEFRALSLGEQGRMIEAVEGMTVVSKMIVRYNPDDEDFFVCAFAANVVSSASTSADNF